LSNTIPRSSASRLFIEIEAIGQKDSINEDELSNQCNQYVKFLDISPEQLIDKSYSDLILEKV